MRGAEEEDYRWPQTKHTAKRVRCTLPRQILGSVQSQFSDHDSCGPRIAQQKFIHVVVATLNPENVPSWYSNAPDPIKLQ